jgi:hypothetical protein
MERDDTVAPAMPSEANLQAAKPVPADALHKE